MSNPRAVAKTYSKAALMTLPHPPRAGPRPFTNPRGHHEQREERRTRRVRVGSNARGLRERRGVPGGGRPCNQLATTRQGLLGDSCNNIDITIINSRERNGVRTAIKVDRVSFWSASEGAWLPEDLSDQVLNFGAGLTCDDNYSATVQ